MATNTYVALDKVTLTSNASDVTFSSIPSGYTDLVVVVMGASTTAGSSTNGLRWQINGDTSSNYSETQIYGDGSTATSTRGTNATDIGAGLLMQTSAGYFATNIISFMNYSNTTTYKTILTRNGGASVSTAANVALWRSTSAITSIKFYRLTDQLKSGSTFSLYGIAAEGSFAKATGGVITSDTNYWYHTFRSSGTFTPLQSLTADYLVVAGGGGGGLQGAGTSYGQGGGGAGGLRCTVGATGGGGSLETPLSLSATAYTVTVGAGGAMNNSGSNSVFSTITSTGGGRGGDGNNANSSAVGGSGGGAAGWSTQYNGSAGTTNQGYKGGNNAGNNIDGAGGGGGAGAVGANGVSGTSGQGGNGIQTSISGVSTYYAGGGGGGGGQSGTLTSVPGGLGGGGNGGGNTTAAASPTAGTANTGGGGGGSGRNSGGGSGSGGTGGSGIVIVRYAKA